MNYSLIAVRYAKALFILVKERGLLEKVSNDLAQINNLLDERNDLMGFLKNPLYKVSQKISIVEQVFINRIQPVTMQFLKLVIEKRREEMLPAIIRNFGDLYRSDQNIKKVVYTSASSYSSDFVGELKNQLELLLKSKIELSLGVKPELIGGFVLMVDGKLVDASISNRLKQMQKRLLS